MPPHYLGLIVKQHLCVLLESASTWAPKDDCYGVSLNMKTDAEGDIAHVIETVYISGN